MAFALIATAALRFTAPTSWARLFLLTSSLIGWGWLAGQMIYSAALNKDDWAFLTWALHWPSAWRVVAMVVGAGLYIGAARLVVPFCSVSGTTQALAAGAASAALAGLLWAKAPVGDALEAFAAVGVAPAVLLLLIKRRKDKINTVAPTLRRSWPWITAAAASYALFLAALSRGLGPLS